MIYCRSQVHMTDVRCCEWAYPADNNLIFDVVTVDSFAIDIRALIPPC